MYGRRKLYINTFKRKLEGKEKKRIRLFYFGARLYSLNVMIFSGDEEVIVMDEAILFKEMFIIAIFFIV